MMFSYGSMDEKILPHENADSKKAISLKTTVFALHIYYFIYSETASLLFTALLCS